jgi:predicted homoserine dehydrogenase-like protein
VLTSGHNPTGAPLNKPLRIGLIGAGMVSRHHLIAWADIAERARVIAIADPSRENAARRAVQSLRDNSRLETAPADNIETLRLVEDCYRLSGWEAAR